MNPEVAERLRRFQDDLPNLDAGQIIRKHITLGDPFVLTRDDLIRLKEAIGDEFTIHPKNVYLVGSGQLGFSIAPQKRYRPFGETSDIDIALVADDLFDAVWEQVFNYRNEVGYWPEERRFKDYLFRGWIRPDKLPNAESFPLGDRWWNFFRGLTRSGEFGMYKITAGLYRTDHFFETYQGICVGQCQSELKK